MDVAYDGSMWSLRMKKKNKLMTKKMIIKQYSKIKVELMYRPVKTKSNDYFEIQTKFNGAGWETYDAYGNLTNNQWKMGTTIIEDFDGKKNVRIQFNTQQDEGYINLSLFAIIQM